MTKLDIEAWVLRVVDQVNRRAHSEDSSVELKRTWPDADSAARRIAAHANAARGELILWVIGLDEKLGVVGAPPEELANWFSSVKACFDGVAPSLIDLNVVVGEKTLVALLFQTDRAPFVVKNPNFNSKNGGPVEFEVPWREGRKTRSARREDLIRLIQPLTLLPEVECLECSLCVTTEAKHNEISMDSWYLRGALYISPNGSTRVVFPFHRSRTKLSQSSGATIESWSQLHLYPSSGTGNVNGVFATKVDSMTVEASSTEAILTGPGKVNFVSNAKLPLSSANREESVLVTIELHVVGATAPVVVEIPLQPANPGKQASAAWSFTGDPV